LRIYTTNVTHVGSRTGNLYASNTVGAVLGSLAGGLVMLPMLGAMTSLALIAILFLCIGSGLALMRDATGERATALPGVGLAALTTCACLAIAVMIPYRVTLNFNQKTLDDAELLYHADGVQNTIDVLRSPSGATSLVIGGNVEADNGYRQRRHFVLKGHLPLLFQEDPRSVLVVGLGMGITLQATANHPGLERIDVIELSPDILAAQAYLEEVNGKIVQNPLVHVQIDDGRLFMKMTPDHFDMITADPIHPKISRVGYLYTAEYYQSIREHLNEGGVVCQWMPIYQISPLRLRSAVKSFVEVFPHATLWYVEGHLLFVAKLDSAMIDYALLERKFQNPAVRADLASIDIDSPEELLSHLMMGPDEIRAFLGDPESVPTNTDDYPYLEYFVPGDLFYSSLDNVRELSQHLATPSDFVRNMPPAAEARLALLGEERKKSILTRRDRNSAD
jgi:spermidine synthase